MMQSEKIDQVAAALAVAVAQVGNVKKDGHNDRQNYSYVSDAALVREVKPALVANGLSLFPAGTSYESRPHTSKGTIGIVTVTWRLLHRSGQWLTLQTVGEGYDTLDKGVYKATTGAYKYLLRTTFCISTGDDPEGPTHVPEDEPDPNTWPKDRERYGKLLREALRLPMGTDMRIVSDWHKQTHNKGIPEMTDVERNHLLDYAHSDECRELVNAFLT